MLQSRETLRECHRQPSTPFLVFSVFLSFLKSMCMRWEQYLQTCSRREHGGYMLCLAPESSTSGHCIAKDANARDLMTILDSLQANESLLLLKLQQQVSLVMDLFLLSCL